MMIRSTFHFVEMTPEKIVIADDANRNGTMSVTNDAENVVESFLEMYGPEMKFFYYDTENELTELCHDGKVFTGFGFPIGD